MARLILLMIVINILLLGCEKPRSKNNNINQKSKIAFVNKSNSAHFEEQDSIHLSLIEFSLNAKEIENMLRVEKQQRIKIFFISKYIITPDSATSFRIFNIDFNIIKSVNETNSYYIMELANFQKNGYSIFLKYTYGGMIITVSITNINNNYQIDDCNVFEN